jgi:hypothetical protein
MLGSFIWSQSFLLVINFCSPSYPDRTLFGPKVLTFPKRITTQNHRTSLLTSLFATSITMFLHNISHQGDLHLAGFKLCIGSTLSIRLHLVSGSQYLHSFISHTIFLSFTPIYSLFLRFTRHFYNSGFIIPIIVTYITHVVLSDN